ncbi:hypothetical protein SAY87_024796 [Trapa incisa]|uniref:C2 domain-containing protein n=1 Tax=Trapa incisa TaxID=236973 RepID=A0AAN7GCL0_9MYRT|nr:hypothetical protein SAY87_024796 [Trapa incisa]
MGKASRWFRSLLGMKKSGSSSPTSTAPQKRRWSFVKSRKDRDGQSHPVALGEIDADCDDPEKHAIAVAAATAAVAEAAVAAAQAAAAVVRLTSSGRCSATVYGRGAGNREEWAALKIQSTFRGYLARRALRALKGLVKIQALVRGHLERKRNARRVQQMKAVLRLQARARAERVMVSESSQSSNVSSHFHHPEPPTPEKFELCAQVRSAKHDWSRTNRKNDSISNGSHNSYHNRLQSGGNGAECVIDERLWDQGHGYSTRIRPEEEYIDKILQVDMMKPVYSTRRKNLLPSNPCSSSGEVQSLCPLEFSHEVEESSVCTAATTSPQYYSASSRGGSRGSSFTPTKSSGSRSFLSGYSDHPNYMAYTESSKAKVRSVSAPKLRPQFEKSTSTKRHLVYGFGDSLSASQVSSSLQSNFANKAYPGSGRLDRLGMPMTQGGTDEFSHPFYPRPAMVQGKLEVLLISARGLEDMDFLNKMDPYVILSYRTQDKRSSIASGQGSEPSWNESFLFTVSGNLSEMKLKILDSDTGTSDDFVGEAIIPLGPVFEEGSIPPTSYKVVKGEAYSGEIRLSLTFTPEVRHDRGLPEEESFGGWKQSSFD